MSFTPTTYVDAYWMSAGESDVTLVTDEDLYRLGQIIDDKEIIGFDPSYTNISHQLMGQWSMKNSKGNYKLTDINADYKMTNCEVFYGMLGKQTDVDQNQRRTITHLDTTVGVGEKPRYNLLTHSGTDKRQLFGCVLKDVGLSWDGGKGYVEAKTKYDALSWKTSSWSGDIYHPGPTVGTTGLGKPFSVLETLTWDSSGDGGADMGSFESPKGVGMQMSQILSSSPGTGSSLGMKEEIDDSLGISLGFMVGYWGNEPQIIEDHKDGNTATLVWKMSKPDILERDIYFEVTASNCTVVQPLPFRENNKTVAYATMIKAETVSIDAKDYLAEYHYTYPRA